MGGGFGAVTCTFVQLLVTKFKNGHGVWCLGSAGNGALCGKTSFPAMFIGRESSSCFHGIVFKPCEWFSETFSQSALSLTSSFPHLLGTQETSLSRVLPMDVLHKDFERCRVGTFSTTLCCLCIPSSGNDSTILLKAM